MNEQGQVLQRAISTRRRMKGPLKVWILMSCPAGTCASQEVNVFVDETQLGCRPWQASCRCPRCGAELNFEGLEA
jgi:hypothetical protein